MNLKFIELNKVGPTSYISYSIKFYTLSNSEMYTVICIHTQSIILRSAPYIDLTINFFSKNGTIWHYCWGWERTIVYKWYIRYVCCMGKSKISFHIDWYPVLIHAVPLHISLDFANKIANEGSEKKIWAIEKECIWREIIIIRKPFDILWRKRFRQVSQS